MKGDMLACIKSGLSPLMYRKNSSVSLEKKNNEWAIHEFSNYG